MCILGGVAGPSDYSTCVDYESINFGPKLVMVVLLLVKTLTAPHVHITRRPLRCALRAAAGNSAPANGS